MTTHWLIVGLGNPGLRYANTRHNIGFKVIDRLMEKNSLTASSKFKSDYAVFRGQGTNMVLLKPLTFMNLSGQAVAQAIRFHPIEIDHIVVVHDDIDQSFGGLKIQKDRGPGGHNGIKSLIESLGSKAFLRVKMGVGRPEGQKPVVQYVLEPFSSQEEKNLTEFINWGAEALEALINKGMQWSASHFNRKEIS